MSLDTRWLEDFLVLAEVRNFSKAAKLRHITQPAFGRRIKSLERAVDQELIDRSSNPIGLTDAGNLFHLTAKTIIAQMEQGLADLSKQSDSIFNPVKIATPHSLSSPTLIELFDSVQQETTIPYSADILRVDFGIQALKEGKCDFFLGFDHIALLQPPFENTLLGEGHFLLVCATENDEPIFSLEDNQTPYLRYTSESYTARLLEQHQPDLPVSLRPVFESSMCQLHKEMALLGKGVAWLPDLLIKKELSDGSLIALSPKQFSLPFSIRLYRYQTKLSPNSELIWLRITDRYSKQAPFSTTWFQND
ncbi:LysR substrate-binding domain-containing protein [Vibrio splendidus]|uniref:LysR substrate-binding domain-containing protein n=1 Tax=Vibrio splendidus TaxID=29497 RepID=A0ABD5AGF2_VIBSP|nr:LysR substrate-binding domain-containing protein [Vibrio splendidus]MDP2492239.1 LysR substrate-binding domain-containing protein [Vibrio splendidus]PMO51814.1 C4-dicarboxylate ABC transporter substrate-binding protein [Vibrio splendidus]